MVEKPGKLMPALAGGLVIGLTSIASSYIPFANLCCCLWAAVGGMVAAYMLINRSPTLRVTSGDGAMAGLMAGVIGSLVFLLIAVPFILKSWGALTAEMLARGEAMNDPASQESVKRMVEFMRNNAALSAIFISLIFAVLFMSFATLGGIIGVAIFEKRKGQPYPPQGPPPAGGYPPGFAPPSPPPGGPIPPPGQAPYGGGEPPPY
ncbi:MAG TPA: hypothetical protein VNI02_10335 [Blastocatellia bacterium]|nr:hypothetical protein [Blastocatellia bacterium]